MIQTPRLAPALLLVLLGACVRPSTPSVAPAPGPSIVESRPVSADSSPALGVANAAATPDSVRPEEVVAATERILGDTAPSPVDSAPTWDLDVQPYASHDRVEHYVRLFSGAGRERIALRLERGSRYEQMIRSKFSEAGLPEDLIYLALIESGFDPHAVSRVGAVGMWQFMNSTARGFGLRVDWWVDERRDPVRSTDAAIRFLKWLNEQFGSMYLAAAAYNGGPGRVARGLTRFEDEMEGSEGEDRFFALAEQNYLPRETKEYVPQLIAVALVAKEPARYGLAIATRPALEYDSVRVGPALPLAAVAMAAGVDTRAIVELNPHVLRGMTPPRDSMWLRVPAGTADSFAVRMKALPREARTAYVRYVTKRGDTPAAVARRGSITERQLRWYNRNLRIVRRTSRLVPGQMVLIPRAAIVAAAHDVPDPTAERIDGRRSRRTHLVRPGETLGHIAIRYRTSVAQLKRLNGLRRETIFAGQTLIVSGTPRPARRSSSSSRTRGR